MLELLTQLDQTTLLWIQDNLRTEMLNYFFTFITRLGNAGVIWILISMGLLVSPKTRRVGIMSLIALVLTTLLDDVILKHLVGRTRPYEVVTGLHSLIEKQNSYSFPSGHTGSSFAAGVILFLSLPRKWGIPALTLAALIGFSRLYLGVHYPTDVICGAIIGSLIAVWVYRTSLTVLEKDISY